MKEQRSEGPDQTSSWMSAPRKELTLLSPVGVVVALFLLYQIRFILIPFVIPAIIAFMLSPVTDVIHMRLHLSRHLVSILLFLTLMLIIIAVSVLAAPSVVHQLSHLTSDFESQIQQFVAILVDNRFVSSLGYHINSHEAASKLTALLRSELATPNAVLTLSEWTFGGFFGLTLAVLLLFYFMVGGLSLSRKLLWLVPPGRRSLALSIWGQLRPALQRYFLGVAVTVIYASVVAYVGLGLILHIKHSIALAFATGFLEMIPIIGPAAAIAIGGLASVHYAANFHAVIGYAIYATVLRLSIDQFFGPVILGRAARLPPPMVIFSFLAGGITFGMIGVILAVPTALAIRSALEIIYDGGTSNDRTRQQRKATPEKV